MTDYMRSTDSHFSDCVQSNSLVGTEVIYDHFLKLFREHYQIKKGVHLDIGCGFWEIAEEICNDLGVKYVGITDYVNRVEYLTKQGIEVFKLDTLNSQELMTCIHNIFKNHQISSLSIIDKDGYFPCQISFLKSLRSIVGKQNIPFLLSIPNVGHRTNILRCISDQFGIVEHCPGHHASLRIFGANTLHETLKSAGWYQIAEYDFLVDSDDKHFFSYNPITSELTNIGILLKYLIDLSNNYSTHYQLFRLCLPGREVDSIDYSKNIQPPPFLSVITRTQGKRLDTLRDVLLSLSAQTNTDFELIIISHKVSCQLHNTIKSLINDTHQELRDKIRLISVRHGNRTTPLNIGFSAARGDYIAILDDDDVIFANWVETFYQLAQKNPGCVLRAAVVEQISEPVKTMYSSPTIRAISEIITRYPSEFDLAGHLNLNQTPPVSLAFPRSSFQFLGIRFDESLTTTEDWDFFMRTANVCSVACSDEITAIYRRWHNAESSQTVHSQQEWRDNHRIIQDKFSKIPFVFAREHLSKLINSTTHFNNFKSNPQIDNGIEYRKIIELRHRAHALYNSKSWRWSFPVRFFGGIIRGRKYVNPNLELMGAYDLELAINKIESSTSWKVTSLLRRVAGYIKGTK